MKSHTTKEILCLHVGPRLKKNLYHLQVIPSTREKKGRSSERIYNVVAVVDIQNGTILGKQTNNFVHVPRLTRLHKKAL